MPKYGKRTFILLCTLLALLPSSALPAGNDGSVDLMTQTRKLDEKTQELKKEVMELGRKLAELAWVGSVRRHSGRRSSALSKEMLAVGNTLNRLEDGLLSPPGIQLVVFVSMDTSPDFTLQQMDVKLDRERLHRRSYTTEDVEHLNRKGTAHRLFTGDIPEGKHLLTLSMVGSKNGQVYRDEANYRFRKGRDRKTIEVRLKSSFGKPRLRIKEWD